MYKITDEEFNLLAAYIKDQSGINLRAEKKTLLVSRLSHVLRDLGIEDFKTYYKMLLKDEAGVEISRLIDRITTNHTYFMRETDHFRYLTERVLPFWDESIGDRDLRVWCAASSSGEEAYTLAILLEEYFGNRLQSWDKKILATDLSKSILDKAKAGIYSEDQVSSLPKTWQLNYFDKKSPKTFQVKEGLKKEVIFRRFNLLEPKFPFKKKFHVIFCRNVMIYFDNPTKEKLIEKMYDSLEVGGYLFIGQSESINKAQTRFKYVKPAIYRKL